MTDSRLRTYESCPRRFFYTHVLGLGGARKTTAFSQTHDCLYRMIDWLAVARADGAPGHAEAVVEFERVWAERGPITHGFAADYKHLADRLIKALVDLGAGRKFRASESLAIDLAGGRLIVEPDEMAETGLSSFGASARVIDGRKKRMNSIIRFIISPAANITVLLTRLRRSISPTRLSNLCL